MGQGFNLITDSCSADLKPKVFSFLRGNYDLHVYDSGKGLLTHIDVCG